jgi:hypothetical protein
MRPRGASPRMNATGKGASASQDDDIKMIAANSTRFSHLRKGALAFRLISFIENPELHLPFGRGMSDNLCLSHTISYLSLFGRYNLVGHASPTVEPATPTSESPRSSNEKQSPLTSYSPKEVAGCDRIMRRFLPAMQSTFQAQGATK